MHYLIYLSSATNLLGEDELDKILIKSRINNLKLGLTGLLIYIDGNIIQLLEGQKDVIDEVFEKISLDKRHTGIIKIVEGPLEKRMFPEWYMGYKSLSSHELKDITGYKNPREIKFEGFHGELKDHPAFIIINSFISNNRG